MSESGRYSFTIGGRTFVVEPIDSNLGKRKLWGDVNPATKGVEGDYGTKYRGAVHPDDSIITEENGFKNIMVLPPGVSPDSFIEELVKNSNK